MASLASNSAGTARAGGRKPDAASLKQFTYVEAAETCLPAAAAGAASGAATGARSPRRDVVPVTSLKKGSFATSLVGAPWVV